MIIAVLFKKHRSVLQFIKFGLVGVTNTAIDFGVLNFLMWVTKIYKGPYILIFNTFSFAAAVVNSYILNKFWTFQEKSRRGIPWQFLKFVIISIVGALLNSSIVFSVTTFVSPFLGISQEIWANFAKVLATAVGLIWNFIGYKFWAFKVTKMGKHKSY